MLDKKSTAVLKVLSKFSEGSAYKVITGDDILATVPQKSQYDLESIKLIIDFLEKQEYLNIKFSEENTYCYSLLPKARICLEQDNQKTRSNRKNPKIMQHIFTMMASFVGTLLAMLVFFYITF